MEVSSCDLYNNALNALTLVYYHAFVKHLNACKRIIKVTAICLFIIYYSWCNTRAQTNTQLFSKYLYSDTILGIQSKYNDTIVSPVCTTCGQIKKEYIVAWVTNTFLLL